MDMQQAVYTCAPLMQRTRACDGIDALGRAGELLPSVCVYHHAHGLPQWRLGDRGTVSAQAARAPARSRAAAG